MNVPTLPGRTTRTAATVLVSLAAAALLGACQTGPQQVLVEREGGTAGVRRPTSTGQALEFDTVHVIDRRLQDWRGPDDHRGSRLLVQATNADLSPTNRVRAFATLQNRTEGPLSVQARTRWFRPDQSPLEDATPWKPIILPPLGVETYEAYSYSTVDRVGHYIIEVKGL